MKYEDAELLVDAYPLWLLVLVIVGTLMLFSGILPEVTFVVVFLLNLAYVIVAQRCLSSSICSDCRLVGFVREDGTIEWIKGEVDADDLD